MKTFTLETAKQLVKHYQYLIGEPISRSFADMTIDAIVIAPIDEQQYSAFLNAYAQSRNYEAALMMSGFDPKEVMVQVLSFSRGNIYHSQLDKHLTDFRKEKIYLTQNP